MDKNRIVVELFFEKPSFEEVSKISKTLEKAEIKSIVMPPDERYMNTHLIIEPSDLPKTRRELKNINIIALEKEVIIITLENKPGSMADAARKISEKGVNLLYAFSVSMSPQMSYVLLGTSDNITALKALS